MDTLQIIGAGLTLIGSSYFFNELMKFKMGQGVYPVIASIFFTVMSVGLSLLFRG